ncbi:hypothetical protein TNCV_2131251 [Trichonephila clavipes]|nr:hypothetical protein TNCV_2131251 [Trichonephila clavipes]
MYVTGSGNKRLRLPNQQSPFICQTQRLMMIRGIFTSHRTRSFLQSSKGISHSPIPWNVRNPYRLLEVGHGEGLVESIFDPTISQKQHRSHEHSTKLRCKEWWVNINVSLFSYSRAFGNGPRHFEPWSRDEDDAKVAASLNFHTTRGHLSLDIFPCIGVLCALGEGSNS